jgi:ADP-ribose pyrophosphatase
MPKSNEQLAAWEVLSDSLDYQTPWFKIHKRKLKTASGVDATYFVHESVSSVMVVTLDDKGRFLIEKQYRPAVEKVEYDYPAGKTEPSDESAEAAAKRELSEETGFEVKDLKLLATLDMNPGFSKDRLHVFLATVSGRGETELDQTESIVTQFLEPRKIQELISNGKMSCTFCVAATYLAFTHLGLLNPGN